MSDSRFGVVRQLLALAVFVGLAVAAFRWSRAQPTAPFARLTARATPAVESVAPAPASTPAPEPIPVPFDPPERPARSDTAEATPPAPPTTEALEDVISRVLPAVVLVETPTGRGTAFFVAPDTLLTNVHVIAGNTTVTIRRGSGSTDIARVWTSAGNFDVAVLKIASPAANQATIPIGSVQRARVGQEVIAIGSPLGTLQNTVTRGIVSAVRQSGGATLVQTDAAVNPGNSGGPLLDRTGTAIGITTMGYTGRQGLNFAVAIDHARDVLDGRVAASTPASGTPDFASLSPQQPSSTDQARAMGAQVFDRTIAVLAQRADVLDNRWRGFKSACYQGRIVGAFDREWYAFFDQRAMQGAVAAGCTVTFSDLQRSADEIRSAVASADEAARQAGVYPGARRDTLRRYRLDALLK